MGYIKLFNNIAAYRDYMNSAPLLPNVSLVEEDESVFYTPEEVISSGYENEYLYFEALEDGMTVSFKEASNDGNLTAASNTLYYSTDKTTWKTLSAENENTEPINAGEKIYFKGNCVLSESGQGIGVFAVSKKYNVAGNVMSILFGDDYVSKTDLTGYDFIFMGLFIDIFAILTGTESNLISAENLILPATTLAENCYSQMFYGCTSLTTAPKLPATTLATECYANMFMGCESLTIAPELPATTLASECYQHMFTGCDSLTTAPELPATTLADYCYDNMFTGCIGLTTAPELPATTLAKYCYHNMFTNCRSLNTAPVLLPATTLAERCYSFMFSGCTSLTTAPELPATTLVDNCYRFMFSDCTSLNYIKMLATDISAPNCLIGWVDNVSATGTFIKSANVNTTENFGPLGWTVQTI